MRYLELKKIEQEGAAPFEYSVALLTILRKAPVPQGITFGEMETVLKIASKIETANGRVALEDSEHAYVWQRVSTYGFPDSHMLYFTFCTDVRDAPTAVGE